MKTCGHSIVRVVTAALTLLLATSGTFAVAVPLETNATASFSQGGFSVDFAVDGLSPVTNAGGTGWALSGSGTAPGAGDDAGSAIAVFKPVTPLAAGSGYNLTFSMFQGGFTNHTLGNFRLSYTTDPSGTFGNGADNGGSVAANWTPLVATAMTSSVAANQPTFHTMLNGTIRVSGNFNELDTYLITAATGPVASAITGFRLEAIETAGLPQNGPGRSVNGNIVLREFSVDALTYPPTEPGQVLLTNATAILSQTGFSVDFLIDNKRPTNSTAGVGWANNGADLDNRATFETQATTATDGSASLFNFELFSGGFSTHEVGRFRISATNADRSLFADGNDNGGAGVGGEPIWTVLDITSISAANPGTIFTELPDQSILVSGALSELETYVISAYGPLTGITGFRLETFQDASLPFGGPGFGPNNGNFVIREFAVMSVVTIPEPATLTLLAFTGAVLLRRRRTA
ncbi:MAG: hypothetical protein WD768_14465 [Phycisphaeraceae bacterium]